MDTPLIGSRLGNRFLAVVLPVTAVAAVLVMLGFYLMTMRVVDEFSLQLSARQVEVDRARARQPILREIEVARVAAQSPELIAWARDESDPELRARGLDELERFRALFEDRSYFFVVDRSGNYYANDGSRLNLVERLRYTLSPDTPADAWYYATRKLAGDCHLNPNYDRVLRVTKLWINCLVRDGDQVLGLVGTGIDLTAFVSDALKASAPNITNLFIDGKGNITAHPDLNRITLQPLTLPERLNGTIFTLFERPEDVEALKRAMNRLQEGGSISETIHAQIDGERHLVSLAYVAPMDWFSVSVVLLEGRLFGEIMKMAILLVPSVILVALLLLLAFNRLVLKRVLLLDQAVRAFKEGGQVDFGAVAPASDELGRLQSHFGEMADSVRTYTDELESLVAERTRELLVQATTDSLTGLRNRRYFFDRLESEISRSRRYGSPLSVVILDIDHFKRINDTHGHDVGDHALVAIAQSLSGMIRQTDVLARYGGEEFTLLMPETGLEAARLKAEQIRDRVCALEVQVDGLSEPLKLTVSQGVAQFDPASMRDGSAILRAADVALYTAKRDGRDRVACAV